MKKLLLLIVLLVTVSVQAEIKGICYSPFWGGESPSSKVGPTYVEEVKDIVLLKSLMTKPRIRTFGIDTNYLRSIPAICESLFVYHTVYCWTSFDYSTTWADGRADLVAFLKAADSLKYKYLEAVGFGYGNMMENSYLSEANAITKIKTEIALTRKAIAAFKVKLTHEENWDIWCRNPSLADSLDFVSIRIMPQDDKVGLPDAAKYVQQCYDSVKVHFPTKDVIVSSVGWSTVSSSELDQKKFLDALVANAKFDYFLFEFADETWKSGAEAKYGLLTSYRDAKLFAVSGKKPAVYMDMFSGDTTKIDGIVYSHSSFGYPVGMSLPALQKQVGYWADTFSQIAKYSFFRSQDFGVADSQLLKIFSDNGNSVGLINGVSSVASAKMILTDVSSYTYYGWKDSLDRQKTVDSLFHFVSVLRQKNRNDSVFIGASVSGFKSGYVDSIKKYPQLVGGFDGLAISFNIYDLRNMSNVSQYVDSMVGVLQARLPGKSLIMIMDVWALDCASGDQDMPIYEAFKKAKAKYGFALVLSNISNFYVSLSAVTVVPSPMYKYLMPWRFPSAVSCFGPSLQKQRSVLCVINQKIVIGNAKTAASLSVYSLSGRLVRQLSIKRNSTFDMRLSGLPAGNFIYKLKAGEESLMGKFLLSR